MNPFVDRFGHLTIEQIFEIVFAEQIKLAPDPCMCQVITERTEMRQFMAIARLLNLPANEMCRRLNSVARSAEPHDVEIVCCENGDRDECGYDYAIKHCNTLGYGKFKAVGDTIYFEGRSGCGWKLHHFIDAIVKHEP